MIEEFSAAAAAFFAREAPLESLRPHLESGPGYDEATWKRFCAELDGARLMLPAAEGGLDAGVEVASAVATQAGRVLYGGPYLTHWLAGLLLSGSGSPRLAAVADGSLRVALTLDGTETDGRRDGDGWVLHGAERPVEHLAESELILAVAGVEDGLGLFAVDPSAAGVSRPPAENLDLTRRTGLLTLAGAPAERLDAGDGSFTETAARVAEIAAVLRAAENLGSARRMHEITVAYAGIREQFGRTIASFQSVKHALADLLVELEGATGALAEAVRLVAEEPGAAQTELAVLTAGLAVDAAFLRVAHDGIQLHGGIGYTWEHDAHLFYRRAAATRNVPGDRSVRLGRLLDLFVDRPEPEPSTEPEVVEDAALAEFRQRARTWLTEAIDRGVAPEVRPGPPGTTPAGLDAAKAYQRSLHEAGLSGITYPVEYGGAGLGPEFEDVFFEETRSTGAGEDKIFRIGISMIGPAILALGNDEQRARLLPPLLRGEEIWCELFSEPGSGSDMAGAQTRAVPDGDDFVVTGQKVWTSNGHLCDFGLLLARTDPQAPKHRGLSMFMVPMDTPGIEVRPLRQITGESDFNEVFLDGVRVGRDQLLGDLHDGWRVARLVLQHERMALGTTAVRRVSAGDLLELAGRRGLDADPLVRARLAEQMLAERRLRSYLEYVADPANLERLPAEAGAVAKLLMSGTMQRAAELAVELLGPAASAWPQGEETGELLQRVLSAQAFSIAGGTDNILRNLIGERALGLPRD